MIYYVNQAMLHDGDGSLGTPFRRISEAAKIAKPGDEVLEIGRASCRERV